MAQSVHANSNDDQTLHGLMARALDGDANAYKRALSRMSERLRSYFAKRLIGRPEDAEDLVQETLMAIHAKRHTYDPARPFVAWMYGIAGYRFIDYLRKNGRAAINVDDMDMVAGAHSFEEAANAAEDTGRLLSILPERTRDLVQKVKIEGMTIGEAANAEGMSENAAKVAIHRAMKTLSAHVTDQEAIG